jgi:hypothetical protein
MAAAQISSNETTGPAIHGNVTDPSGAVIPGAMVTVSNGQWSRTVSTDEAGQYTVSGIAPGHYHVRVHFGGFTPFDKGNFVVTTGRETEVNAQLELREVRQTVSVFE